VDFGIPKDRAVTYRDNSADVTLDNANEGIMSIEFLAWAECATFHSGHDVNTPEAFAAWNARQPEIDALKRGGSLREVTYLKTEIQLMVEQREKLWREIDALKAENERLRRAAEEFISWFDGEEYLDEIAYQVDSLRAALEKK
jgi:hypothetical protein